MRMQFFFSCFNIGAIEIRHINSYIYTAHLDNDIFIKLGLHFGPKEQDKKTSWPSGATRGSLLTVAKGTRCRDALEPTIRVLNPKLNEERELGRFSIAITLFFPP